MPALRALWSRFSSYITVGLAVTTLATGTMWHVTGLRLDASKAENRALVASYEAASAQATLAAEQNKNEIEKEYRKRAEETDRELGDLLSRYNASLVRYANRSQASGTTSPTPDRGPEGSNGPGESTVLPSDMILIPYTDAEICAENTARLQVVRDWVLNDLNDVE